MGKAEDSEWVVYVRLTHQSNVLNAFQAGAAKNPEISNFNSTLSNLAEF